jgi:hypothetical protein
MAQRIQERKSAIFQNSLTMRQLRHMKTSQKKTEGRILLLSGYLHHGKFINLNEMR